jgi:hypothetical protein
MKGSDSLMRRRLKIFILVSLAVFGLATEEYFRLVRPFLSRGKQIGNVVFFRFCSVELDRHYEAHGEYPLDLSELLHGESWFDGKDRWGHPLLYLSDGTMYILVSTGRDGQPDGINYLAARMEEPPDGPSRKCSTFDADQILSDRGWYRGCGK